MNKEIIDRIKDLADCFKGEGVPNIAYVEAGILELDKIVSSSNVIPDVSVSCVGCIYCVDNGATKHQYEKYTCLVSNNNIVDPHNHSCKYYKKHEK